MLDSYTITQYVAACANRAGVPIVWERDATPSTDGKRITLPILDAYASHNDKVKLIQFVKHETSHIMYSDFDLLNENNPQGLLAFINNLLEDHRIDFLNDSEYAGDKNNSEEFYKVYADGLKGKEFSPIALDVYMPLFAWDLDVRDDLWTRTADPFTLSTKEAERVYNLLHKNGYADVLRNIRTIKDKREGGVEIYALAEKILREVFGLSPDECEKKEPEDKAGKKPKEGDEKSDSLAEGSVSGIGAATPEGEGMPTPYAEHAPDGESRGKKGGKGAVGGGAEGYTPTPANEILHYNFVKNKGNFTPPSIDPRYANMFMNIAARGEALSNQIRCKLQIMTRDKYEYGKKKGKLNGASLYRVNMKNVGSLNERLFKRKIVNKQLDCAIQILIDASGSMAGEKYENAVGSAIILNKVLCNVLQLPVEILAFTDRSKAHVMFTIKEFDNKIGDTSIANSMSSVASFLLDNVDGESLVYGYTRIAKRKENRKMMIVLSDGYPCGGRRRGNIEKYTRNVIRNIEKTSVELLGIGLCHSGVSEYYKRNTNIVSASDIERALLSIISNNILKGVI